MLFEGAPCYLDTLPPRSPESRGTRRRCVPRVQDMPGPHLRQILKALPCRPQELPRFRGAVCGLFKDSTQPDTVAREVAFYLQALQKQRELNDRYFKPSELSEKDRLSKLANTVGLQLPNAEAK